MKPLEAWRIISSNLNQLYRFRQSVSQPHIKAYSQEEVEAEVICFEALKAMQEGELYEDDGK